MFTGLIEAVGLILERSPVRDGTGQRLHIATPLSWDLSRGDSIAVSGICLTVEDREGDAFTVTAVPTTLDRTTAGTWVAGARVNLERALAANGRLGGHFVQGHVDGVGRLDARQDDDGGLVLTLRAPAPLLRIIVPRGSVAVDGVSLTVAERTPDGFAVAIIPHTALATTLGRLRPGDAVNLETDILGKYVEQLLSERKEE